jgi:hypothetical protein
MMSVASATSPPPGSPRAARSAVIAINAGALWPMPGGISSAPWVDVRLHPAAGGGLTQAGIRPITGSPVEARALPAIPVCWTLGWHVTRIGPTLASGRRKSRPESRLFTAQSGAHRPAGCGDGPPHRVQADPPLHGFAVPAALAGCDVRYATLGLEEDPIVQNRIRVGPNTSPSICRSFGALQVTLLQTMRLCPRP